MDLPSDGACPYTRVTYSEEEPASRYVEPTRRSEGERWRARDVCERESCVTSCIPQARHFAARFICQGGVLDSWPRRSRPCIVGISGRGQGHQPSGFNDWQARAGKVKPDRAEIRMANGCKGRPSNDCSINWLGTPQTLLERRTPAALQGYLAHKKQPPP